MTHTWLLSPHHSARDAILVAIFGRRAASSACGLLLHTELLCVGKSERAQRAAATQFGDRVGDDTILNEAEAKMTEGCCFQALT